VNVFNLDRHGFTLVTHRSAVRDFFSDAEVKRVYYPEAEPEGSRVPSGCALICRGPAVIRCKAKIHDPACKEAPAGPAAAVRA